MTGVGRVLVTVYEAEPENGPPTGPEAVRPVAGVTEKAVWPISSECARSWLRLLVRSVKRTVPV